MIGRSLRSAGCVLAVAATLGVAPPAAAQDVYLVVVVGLAGEPEHGEVFSRWASTLVDAAASRMGVAPERIVYLAEKPEQDPKRISGRSTKAEIQKAFAALARKVSADDVVVTLLIGHGSFDGKTAKFNLPQADMGPADFEPLLDALPTRNVAFINTSSASGPFAAELAAPGRTVVTATRSGSEKFATRFGGYFVDALTGDAADADKNGRISILEAFNAAKLDVTRAYERDGLMLTENALLEDKAGKAATLALGSIAPAAPLPDDPKLRALYQEQRELERRVEALKLQKTGMDPARYASELERLLTELALKGREIRAAGGRQ